MSIDSKEKENKNNKGFDAVLKGSKTVFVVLLVILAVLITALFATKAYTLGYGVSSYKPSKESKDIEVSITSDMTVKDVGNLLIEKGILNEEITPFIIQERLSDYHDKFLPGTYTLSPSMSVDEILKIISTDPKANDKSR